MVPDRLWYRTNCGTRLFYLGLSIFMYRPGQLPGRSSVISGQLQAGGNSIFYVWLECPYFNPPEGLPGQIVYTFVICILWTSRDV
jgi:hypothetical protein